MKPRTLLFIFLGVLTLLRLIYISQVELVADESYYYLWSQHPDLSYYSKGPGVAMAIRFATAIFGANEFGVRWLSPLLSLGTCLIMFYFARRLYNESVAIWTVLAMNALPIFNVGSVVMTIDPLSIFFWTAAMATFWLALDKDQGFNWHWPLTGLLIGIGFLAKYTNAMELISIALVLALTKRFRVQFLRPGFWSMLVVFLGCTAPVVFWNGSHDNITIAHLMEHGNIHSKGLHPGGTLTFIAGQLGVYSPLIFIGMMMALWWSRKEAMVKFKPRFLAMFALPILVMYLFVSLKNSGQPNWTALSYISLGILTVAMWHDAVESKPGRKRLVGWALGIGIFMTIGFFGSDLLRSMDLPLPYNASVGSIPTGIQRDPETGHFVTKWSKLKVMDPNLRSLGWETMAATVGDYRQQFEKETKAPAFLIAKDYETASLLSFYLPDKRTEGPGHPPVYVVESQAIENEFSFWPKYDDFLHNIPKPQTQNPQDYYTGEEGVNPFTGRNALYSTDDVDDIPPSNIIRGFQRIEMVKMFDVVRHGQLLRQVRIFACYNYQTVSL
ncbi:MAG TPA: glycosyltransferase family 39 protein [Chthoniobacteraceae bacterium]|nr:glycosyltransferase family 39 protein [Chthoniobacteraceae bacterium]